MASPINLCCLIQIPWNANKELPQQKCAKGYRPGDQWQEHARVCIPEIQILAQYVRRYQPYYNRHHNR